MSDPNADDYIEELEAEIERQREKLLELQSSQLFNRGLIYDLRNVMRQLVLYAGAESLSEGLVEAAEQLMSVKEEDWA